MMNFLSGLLQLQPEVAWSLSTAARGLPVQEPFLLLTEPVGSQDSNAGVGVRAGGAHTGVGVRVRGAATCASFPVVYASSDI